MNMLIGIVLQYLLCLYNHENKKTVTYLYKIHYSETKKCKFLSWEDVKLALPAPAARL